MDHFRPLLKVRHHASGAQTIQAKIRLAMRLNGTEIEARTLFEHNGQTYSGPVKTVIDDALEA